MSNETQPEAPEISKAALKAYIPEPPAEDDDGTN
jgi:hypothetical protein